MNRSLPKICHKNLESPENLDKTGVGSLRSQQKAPHDAVIVDDKGPRLKSKEKLAATDGASEPTGK